MCTPHIPHFVLLSVFQLAALGFVGRNLVCYLVEHELCSKVRIYTCILQLTVVSRGWRGTLIYKLCGYAPL